MDSKQFNLLATLDKSSSGTTMLAENKTSHKLCAIKVMKKEFMSISTDRIKDLFLHDERHPFIQDLEGSFESSTCMHLVLEFAQAGNLMWHIQQSKYEFERAHLYAAEICLAIKFFHEKGVVHRDLTLGNISLDSTGHVKVSGYEMYKGGMSHGSKTSTFCGTSGFLAPEVLLDDGTTISGGYGYPVDWWSFGILLYQMLVRQEPFLSESTDGIFDDILEEEPSYPAELSAESVAIIQRLLVKQPAGRLGSSVRDALDVMEHPFFRSLNWDDVYHKKVPVPFKPQLDHERDLRYFELEFTRDVTVISPCNDW